MRNWKFRAQIKAKEQGERQPPGDCLGPETRPLKGTAPSPQK
jgi:hypothetical protein